MKYHVGCGFFGVYAGILDGKNQNKWKDKTNCTDEAICAVRDYMAQEFFEDFDKPKNNTGCYTWTLQDGRIIELRITIKEQD